MSKREDDTHKLYGAWRQAEARYAALLSELPDEPPTKVSKDAALALAKARARAAKP